ncbi:MAG: aspartate kinase [Methanocellales archaeon]|nr:aspartate kinase [Methanocellales archaeon]MDD3291399.1 aspartate kinase [Methanocellales archaeon]MDD5234711.1 aspartate kinase [Methanocellales archaeon]MDD5484938.1 aspartate kinase [Methanocellales archaeon]
MKFGGTSVADGSKIKNVASLIKRFYDEKNEIIIVVSALSGVTDQLEKAARKAAEDGGIADVKAFIEHLRGRHYAVAQEAVAEGEIKVVIEELDARLKDLENALISICHLRELTARSHDYLSSFGERLSAPILSASLKSMNLRSIALTGGDAGIVTDSNFKCARPLLDMTYVKVKERIYPLLEKKIIPVITGFVAADAKGIITTLSRGGSDYTASIIGAAIDADEIWIWTDVDGIMTADPRIISEARTLPIISYLEAMELSYFGAKVLHPKTIEPAIQKGITVRVRNTFNPDHPGTLIIKAHEHIKDIVKAVTLIQNIALINISGSGMAGTPGVAGRVFSALGRIGANIMMISQGSSEANISLVIDKTQLDISLHALQTEFTENIIKDISYDENVCVIAVVGDGMAGTPGVAGRVFSALGRIGANIMMISQGSSEANISFVVNRSDAQKALRALHDEFKLGVER